MRDDVDDEEDDDNLIPGLGAHQSVHPTMEFFTLAGTSTYLLAA
jgi:hypothetical protein